MSENINPIELLKEEMDHDDLAIRVNAIHRLRTIVVLTGGETFKNQILPYLEGISLAAPNTSSNPTLQDSLKKKMTRFYLPLQKNSEVNCVYLHIINYLIPDISNLLHGGYTIILPALETLASVEETVVRDAVR